MSSGVKPLNIKRSKRNLTRQRSTPSLAAKGSKESLRGSGKIEQREKESHRMVSYAKLDRKIPPKEFPKGGTDVSAFSDDSEPQSSPIAARQKPTRQMPDTPTKVSVRQIRKTADSLENLRLKAKQAAAKKSAALAPVPMDATEQAYEDVLRAIDLLTHMPKASK